MRNFVWIVLVAGIVSSANAQPAPGAEPTAPAIGKMGPGMAGGSGPKYPRQTDCRSNPEACAAGEKARMACRKLKGQARRQCLQEHRKAQ